MALSESSCLTSFKKTWNSPTAAEVGQILAWLSKVAIYGIKMNLVLNDARKLNDFSNSKPLADALLGLYCLWVALVRLASASGAIINGSTRQKRSNRLMAICSLFLLADWSTNAFFLYDLVPEEERHRGYIALFSLVSGICLKQTIEYRLPAGALIKTCKNLKQKGVIAPVFGVAMFLYVMAWVGINLYFYEKGAEGIAEDVIKHEVDGTMLYTFAAVATCSALPVSFIGSSGVLGLFDVLKNVFKQLKADCSKGIVLVIGFLISLICQSLMVYVSVDSVYCKVYSLIRPGNSTNATNAILEECREGLTIDPFAVSPQNFSLIALSLFIAVVGSVYDLNTFFRNAEALNQYLSMRLSSCCAGDREDAVHESVNGGGGESQPLLGGEGGSNTPPPEVGGYQSDGDQSDGDQSDVGSVADDPDATKLGAVTY